MKRQHQIAIAAAVALSASAVGGAIAATKLTPRHESQAVIADAARQLGVEPQELSNALKEALKNRVDAAVTNGRLTREQGQRMKDRIEAGGVPLLRFGLIGPGHERRHAKLEAATAYLGMTDAQLREALGTGKTLAQIARDRGKSVGGLIDALVQAARERLGADSERLDELRARIEELVQGRAPRFGRPHLRRGDDRVLVRPGVF